MNPPDSDSTLTLLHFGDLHLWRLASDGDFFPKRLLGLANLILRRARRFPPALAHAVVERMAGEQADAVLFSGDLTTTALRQEFDDARRLLEPLRERWGERFLAIPGNHDRYTPRAQHQQHFEKIFLQDISRPLPWSVDLSSHWSLVALDCSVPRWLSSRGRFESSDLQRLAVVLEEERKRERRVIVMGHYPLVYPPGQRASLEHVLPQRAQLCQLLLDFGVRIYLHGHKHRRWWIEKDGLVHLNCGAAGMASDDPTRQAGYLKITLGPSTLTDVQIVHCGGRGEETFAWACTPLKKLTLTQE